MSETFGDLYPHDEPEAAQLEQAHMDALRENAARRIGLSPEATWEAIAEARRQRLESEKTPDTP